MNPPARSPDTINTPLPKLTVSSRGDLACSLKWSLTRVKKLAWSGPREFPPSVGRGLALHSCLHALHAARWDDNLPMDDLPTFARQSAYAARYGPGVSRDSEAEIVEEMARLFVGHQDPEDVHCIIALETQVEFDYFFRGEGLARISATIDRALCRTPGVLTIQDYKTTKQKLAMDECFLILWCASRKWPEYARWELELVWINLEEGTVTVDVISHRHVRGQIKILTAALLRVLHQPPVAEPSADCCKWCINRENCQNLDPVNLDVDDVDVFRIEELRGVLR